MKVIYSHGPKQGETVDVSPREAGRLVRAGAAVVSDTQTMPKPEPVVEPVKESEQKPHKTIRRPSNG